MSDLFNPALGIGLARILVIEEKGGRVMRKLLPEPKSRPLSRQTERACAITLGIGVSLMVPAAMLDGTFGRELLFGSVTCVIVVGPVAMYQFVQSLRYLRRP